MNDIAQVAPATPAAAPANEVHDRFLVSGTDIFALGHYPGNPIYPGVLIAERLCRLAETLAFREFGQVASVAAIKRIQYLDAVLPGDVVELTATVKKANGDQLEIATSARVGDKPKTRATLLCSRGARTAADGAVPQPAAPGEKAVPHRGLGAILPHRYPFLLLDTIEDFETGKWIRARKIVNRASPLFLEQQPKSYPQGLVIESIGQAGIALFFLSRESQEPMDIVLGSIGDTELALDVPFDVALTLQARIERILPNGVVFSGEALIGDQVVTRIGSLVAMIDPR